VAPTWELSRLSLLRHLKGGPFGLPLRAANKILSIPLLLYKGVAKAALYCAHRASTF